MSATTSHSHSPAPLDAGRKFVLAALLVALFAMFVGSFVYRMQGAGLVVEIKQEHGGRGGGMGGAMGGAMGGIDMEHLRDLMQTVEKNPNDPKLLLELGNTFMMMQAWDKALEYVDKAVKAAPEDPQAHRAMGMVRFERKEYPQARKSFETVLKKEPGDAMAHYNLGILLKHYLKLPAEGDAHFRKVVQLGDKVNPEILKSAEQELAAPVQK